MARRQYRTGSIKRRGDRWLVRWSEDGQRRAKSFGEKTLAQRFLASRLGVAAARGARLRPEPKHVPTLQGLFDDWIAAREKSHRDWDNDRKRWAKHLGPAVGKLRPDDVDQGVLRSLVARGRAGKLSPTTIRLVLRLLSTFFSDLKDDGYASSNPVKDMDRRAWRALKPLHDPRDTPFTERLEDIRRICLALPWPISVAYAIGALAGLRTGEVIALRGTRIDLDAGRIHVCEAVRNRKLGRPKDGDTRFVPIQDALRPILAAWKLRTGGAGLVVPPWRRNQPYAAPAALNKALGEALAALRLPTLTWYQATRHTYASQFVLGGGELSVLRDHLGHSTVTVTERYAHLQRRSSTADAGRIVVDLVPVADPKLIPFARPTVTTDSAPARASSDGGAHS